MPMSSHMPATASAMPTVSTSCGNMQHLDLEPVRVAALGQQLLGPFRVVGREVPVLVVGDRERLVADQRAAGQRALTVQDAVQDQLTVDGQREGLADGAAFGVGGVEALDPWRFDVGQLVVTEVGATEHHVGVADVLVGHDLQTGRLGLAGQLARQLPHADRAGLDLREDRRAVPDRFQDQPVVGRLLAARVLAWGLFEHHLHARV